MEIDVTTKECSTLKTTCLKIIVNDGMYGALCTQQLDNYRWHILQ